jgi:hypothetical protein
MTRRILLTAVLTLGIGAGYWMYIAWPEWFGAEIRVDAILGLPDRHTSRTALDWPSGRVLLTIPHAEADDSPMPFHEVRQIGPVWPATSDPLRGARLMHGRTLYLQVERRASAEGGSALAEPVSISTTPIAGATNLRVHVTRATPSGRMYLVLGPSVYPAPSTLAPDALTAAVLRVLPSGRFTMVGLVAR